MASYVRLDDGTRFISGWHVEDIKVSVSGSPDHMPIPLGSSADAFLMDYGGRERTIMLRGVLESGTALGTGDNFASVTALEDMVSEIDAHFVNLDTTGTTFSLKIYDSTPTLKHTYTGVVENWEVTRTSTVHFEFTMKFVEGTT